MAVSGAIVRSPLRMAARRDRQTGRGSRGRCVRVGSSYSESWGRIQLKICRYFSASTTTSGPLRILIGLRCLCFRDPEGGSLTSARIPFSDRAWPLIVIRPMSGPE